MDYFAKKQWIRIAVCAVLVGAIVLGMTGVFSGTGSLKYDPSAKNLPAGASEAEVTEQGFGGDVTAHVVLNGNTVQELTIDTPNETEGLGKRASDAEFTEQFIGKEGPFTFGENGIEALSGATVTSTAALKAINKAITGEDAAEEPAPAAAETADADFLGKPFPDFTVTDTEGNTFTLSEALKDHKAGHPKRRLPSSLSARAAPSPMVKTGLTPWPARQ